jgi:hypothetical protein
MRGKAFQLCQEFLGHRSPAPPLLAPDVGQPAAFLITEASPQTDGKVMSRATVQLVGLRQPLL